MTNWRKRVNVRSILEDEDLTEAEQAAQILALLKRHPEFAGEDDGILIEEMGGLRQSARCRPAPRTGLV